MERVVGIEPTFPAWKAGVLPIYDTRIFEILNLLFNQLNILILLEFLLVKLVGVTGIEPATSWSQTTRAPICATPREHLVSLENTLSLNDKDYSTISYLIRQHFFSTFFIFFHFFYFNSSINASTG